MNEIKVTVTYEKPNTSKFDALMAEYKTAKQLADETVSYYKPLADVAEKSKFNAIMDQLETIKMYAKQIYDLQTYQKTVTLKAYIDHITRNSQSYNSYAFEVTCREGTNFYVTWDKELFSMENIKKWHHMYCEGDRNILGHWDEWKVYEKLEEEACRQLKVLIDNQASRAQKQIDRLNNIVKN